MFADMGKYVAFVILLLTSVVTTMAQPAQQKYNRAKALFNEGRYNLAQEAFKELIPYSQDNPFSQYASFYYALSAYHQGYRAVARDMLLQIKSLYPSWNQMDEVNLWLARIYFDDKAWFQGMQALAEVQDNKTQKYKEALKKQALTQVTELHVAKALYDKYPEDEAIAYRLALLLGQSTLPADRQQLQTLVAKFGWKDTGAEEEALPAIKKQVYSVALLFPFLTSTLEPTPLRKRNQFVLDLYEGMKMAADSLGRAGIKISLRAYDTDRKPETVKRLLATEELQAADLIVGPLFPEENQPAQQFSRQQRINLFNPVTHNYEVVSDNPYGFLFQPSVETMGREAALFLDAYLPNHRKKCMVILGDNRRDSVLAAHFLMKAKDTGLRIMQLEKVSRSESGRILSILATPTAFDEFKYPVQFTLPKDSLGCIFVASDDPLIYTKVISSVETRKDSIVVLGSEAWLDHTAVAFEKYQQLGVVLFAPNFVPFAHPEVKKFYARYAGIHGRSSASSPYTDYARLGFEFMLFTGRLLHEEGVYFQQSLTRRQLHTVFGRKVRYENNNRSNQVVPFIKFYNGELTEIPYSKP